MWGQQDLRDHGCGVKLYDSPGTVFSFLTTLSLKQFDLDISFFSSHCQLTILSEFQHTQLNKEEIIRLWVFGFSYIVKNKFYFQLLL